MRIAGSGLLQNLVAATLIHVLVFPAARAQDATWLGGLSADWNNPTNWSTGAQPSGTARFGASSQSLLQFSSTTTPTSIGALQLNPGAPAYSYNLNNNTLQINGAGISNNSSSAPTFNVGGDATLSFLNSTAGNAVINNNGTTRLSGNATGDRKSTRLNSRHQIIS